MNERYHKLVFAICCVIGIILIGLGIYLKWFHPRSDEQRVLRLQNRVECLEKYVKELKQRKPCKCPPVRSVSRSR